MLLLLLAALQASQGPADKVLSSARQAVAQLNDTAAARAEGLAP